MSNLPISDLPVLTGESLAPADALALADLSASETVQITTKNFIQWGIGLIDNGTIPWAKVGTVVLPANTVTTTSINAQAVTAVKFADQSSAVYQATGTLPTGVFVGQVGVTDGMVYIWSGGAWVSLTAPGSINTISGDSTGISLVSVSQTGDAVTLDTSLANTSAARQFLAGPTANLGAVSYRQIVGGDLPTATTTTQGAIIVNGGGLTISGSTISIDNTVTSTAAGTIYGVVKYDGQGLVTDGRAITSADLPAATSALKGAVLPSSNLSVNAAGVLDIANTITGGMATKVTVDSKGLVTSMTSLVEGDIPSLGAAKITSGEFDPARYGDKTIERGKLANYSITFIQEAAPSTSDTSIFIGCLWFQESTAQLRMWNGNSWMPVGFGRLSADNLRFGGLIDANTGNVAGVTNAGTTAGLVIGAALPTATDTLGGLYVVVETAGSSIGVAAVSGVSFAAGDWCLCVSEDEGWEKIAVGQGGGGSGYTYLYQLLDTAIPSTVAAGEILVYSSTGLWTAVESLDGGTY